MVQPAERADARANRQRLVAAALAVFRERGLDAEIKLIAERAGVGVGTIYRNFPTKAELISAIVGEAIQQLLASIVACRTADDPITGLRNLLTGGFQVLEEYGDIFHAMMGGDMPPDCHHQFAEIDSLDDVAAVIQRGIDAGRFRSTLDARLAASKLMSSFTPWHYAEIRQTHSIAQVIDGHLDLFLYGAMRREPS